MAQRWGMDIEQGLAHARTLAERVGSGAPRAGAVDTEPPDPMALELLPVELQQRYQALPIAWDGDVLVVAINDDGSVAALKGPGQPVLPAVERRCPIR